MFFDWYWRIMDFFKMKIWEGEIGVFVCLLKFNYNFKIDFFFKDLV